VHRLQFRWSIFFLPLLAFICIELMKKAQTLLFGQHIRATAWLNESTNSADLRGIATKK
jgi:hypothetical protein